MIKDSDLRSGLRYGWSASGGIPMENGVGTAQDPPSEFAVKDCALLAIATGRRVYTLSELRGGLESVGE
ncbi:hypothetical protein HF282_13110, partial [Acidithiobacillus ferrooxidans]|nr:hypothetical protein [Acidithiobacillus ferrooxidans]